jgi:hypothetical protein
VTHWLYWALLVLMVMIWALQIVGLVMALRRRPVEEEDPAGYRLLDDTLRMQGVTLHELIKRVREVERRLNAMKLPEASER